MNRRTKSLLKAYDPVMALVVYKADHEQYYLESHPIAKNGQLLEGKPLSEETIDDMVGFFYDEKKNRSEISGLIPENLLQYQVLSGGGYAMTWYRPAEERRLYFSDALHLPLGTAWVPAMLYRVQEDDLYVFALDQSCRPTIKNIPYKAPFHNVYADGKVCLGSAKVKKPDKKTYESVIKYWEDMFWLSEFSHLVSNQNPTKTNINMLWKDMIEMQQPAFPFEELIPHDTKSVKLFYE